MHCPQCESPFLKAPGIGWYCPTLECAWHDESPETDAIAAYERGRRDRDGQVYAGMPQDAWLKMLEKTQRDCEALEGIWRAVRR